MKKQYINKSALVAEIEKTYNFHEKRGNIHDASICDVLYGLLHRINTLEVKEVDIATTEQLIEAAKTVVRERYKFRPLPIYLLEEALESLGINWEE